MREVVDALKANGGVLNIGGYTIKYVGSFPYTDGPQPEDPTERKDHAG